MHAQVTRAQFKIKDATVVHSPAGAELIPQAGDQSLCGRGTSVGSCPARTSIGTGDVLDMMRIVWRESCSRIRPRLEPMGAA
jgi:hypothetical protein